ncbi:hypothetical protein OXX80_004555 [Metschnikowia pulcherrima]
MIESLAGAAHWVVRLVSFAVLFPFTHVCFPIARLCYAIVNHLLLIPILLIFRTVVYGVIYIPLLPFLNAASVEYDTLVPVEVTLYRLAIGFLPHVHVFMYHFVHFFMVSLFVGTFVGMVAGFNISIISRILYIPEAKADHAVKRLGDMPVKAPDWKRVKREAHFAPIPEKSVRPEMKDESKPIEQAPQSSPVKTEPPNFSGPRVPELPEFPSDSIFEDDDGYDFMTYKISDERRKQIKKDNFNKRRETRYRAVPSSLHMTIEEESESEITPTPTHPTATVFPTNHVSLDYATGTIGSSKTFSTDSSVFSKKLGDSRAEAKDETLHDSPDDSTDVSADETETRDRNSTGLKPAGESRPSHATSNDYDKTHVDDASVSSTKDKSDILSPQGSDQNGIVEK